MSLLRKHIWSTSVYVVRPLVVLDRPPNGDWNWQRIFPRDTTPKPPSQQTGWGDWLRFTNVSVVGRPADRAHAVESERAAEPARRATARSATRSAASRRLIIQRVPGGFQKTVQLDSVNGDAAAAAALRAGHQGSAAGSVGAVDEGVSVPSARRDRSRSRRASFPFNNDSVVVEGRVRRAAAARRRRGDGSYAFASGDMTLTRAQRSGELRRHALGVSALAGERPRQARSRARSGAARCRTTRSRTPTSRSADAHVTGAFGITLGDTITIHDTNLRFTGVDTRTLEQLIPDFKSPRRGVFAGRATVSGGRHALAVNGDVTFDDARAGASRVIAVGESDSSTTAAFARATCACRCCRCRSRWRARGCRRCRSAAWSRARRTVNGIDEHAARGRRRTSTIAIAARTRRSTDTATCGSPGGKWFDVDVIAQPVSLVEVGRFFPAAGLQGTATGPMHLTGTLARPARQRRPATCPTAAVSTTRGTLDLASTEKGYDLTSHAVHAQSAHDHDQGAGHVAHRARDGARPRLRARRRCARRSPRISSTSRWDTHRGGHGVGARERSATASRTSSGSTPTARTRRRRRQRHVRARRAARAATLNYRVAVDSLGAFNRWIPQSPRIDRSPVAPRPRRRGARVRRRRARIRRASRARRRWSV